MNKDKKKSLVKNDLRKISSIRTCVCHMVREMGDCSLNEIVKQYKRNML
jgi:hypothetical protein